MCTRVLLLVKRRREDVIDIDIGEHARTSTHILFLSSLCIASYRCSEPAGWKGGGTAVSVNVLNIH
jgi:hypothetical protein